MKELVSKYRLPYGAIIALGGIPIERYIEQIGTEPVVARYLISRRFLLDGQHACSFRHFEPVFFAGSKVEGYADILVLAKPGPEPGKLVIEDLLVVESTTANNAVVSVNPLKYPLNQKKYYDHILVAKIDNHFRSMISGGRTGLSRDFRAWGAMFIAHRDIYPGGAEEVRRKVEELLETNDFASVAGTGGIGIIDDAVSMCFSAEVTSFSTAMDMLISMLPGFEERVRRKEEKRLEERVEELEKTITALREEFKGMGENIRTITQQLSEIAERTVSSVREELREIETRLVRLMGVDEALKYAVERVKRVKGVASVAMYKERDVSKIAVTHEKDADISIVDRVLKSLGIDYAVSRSPTLVPGVVRTVYIVGAKTKEKPQAEKKIVEKPPEKPVERTLTREEIMETIEKYRSQEYPYTWIRKDLEEKNIPYSFLGPYPLRIGGLKSALALVVIDTRRRPPAPTLSEVAKAVEKAVEETMKTTNNYEEVMNNIRKALENLRIGYTVAGPIYSQLWSFDEKTLVAGFTTFIVI
jgi:uncharacterized protein YoxC